MLTERQPGTLPSNTESNRREHYKAITLQSGKQLSSSLPVANDDDIVVQDEPAMKEPEPEKINPMRAEDRKKNLVKEYQPPILYPARLRQEKVDQQFGKFLDLFKQLCINLPFVEAILQMPKYAKFLKEILSNKRRLEDLGLVILSEECTAILQNKLPVKKHDPRSFTIPYAIGELTASGALADLGASINLMPTSLFDKLGLSEPKPTRMSIQLADRTIKIPRGIIKDVLVKVNKFIFPVDFVVMDMEGESVVPLILGKPLLATSRVVIDEIFLDDPLQVALQGDERELSNEQVLEQLACLLASEHNRSTDPFVSIDSSWVSPEQVVPKKGGMTVIKNEKDELIPIRTLHYIEFVQHKKEFGQFQDETRAQFQGLNYMLQQLMHGLDRLLHGSCATTTAPPSVPSPTPHPPTDPTSEDVPLADYQQ
ncbi:uncharacterized protein LOC125369335 [Ricinus communis]|uniref:uncharacterized protein LOC125369335 n=1 Tax=Ricinus communis TaxID=3988 RepID=UPI00201A824B|nr:uncharacterized protein LOC125369335 [Ricinus communis]